MYRLVDIVIDYQIGESEGADANGAVGAGRIGKEETVLESCCLSLRRTYLSQSKSPV
jgi:hypothetical protein